MCDVCGRVAPDNGRDGGFAGVVSAVAAGFGDAAGEEEFSVGGVEECLAAGEGAEATGFGGVFVGEDGYAGDGGGAGPEVGVFPSGGHAGGAVDQDGGADFSVEVCHEAGEFADGSAGAG